MAMDRVQLLFRLELPLRERVFAVRGIEDDRWRLLVDGPRRRAAALIPRTEAEPEGLKSKADKVDVRGIRDSKTGHLAEMSNTDRP